MLLEFLESVGCFLLHRPGCEELSGDLSVPFRDWLPLLRCAECAERKRGRSRGRGGARGRGRRSFSGAEAQVPEPAPRQNLEGVPLDAATLLSQPRVWRIIIIIVIWIHLRCQDVSGNDTPVDLHKVLSFPWCSLLGFLH